MNRSLSKRALSQRIFPQRHDLLLHSRRAGLFVGLHPQLEEASSSCSTWATVPECHSTQSWSGRRLANNQRGNNKFSPIDFMIISIIQAEPFALLSLSFSLLSERERRGYSGAAGDITSILCGGSPPCFSASPVPPELRRRANFSNSIQIWQRSEKKRRKEEGNGEGDFFESLRENRQINLGRPARAHLYLRPTSRRRQSDGGKECLAVRALVIGVAAGYLKFTEMTLTHEIPCPNPCA